MKKLKGKIKKWRSLATAPNHQQRRYTTKKDGEKLIARSQSHQQQYFGKSLQ